MAERSLEGIEDAALELAQLAAGDRTLMERARRLLLVELDRRPTDPTLVQMHWLWRRAFEKGSWDWDDASSVPADVGARWL